MSIARKCKVDGCKGYGYPDNKGRTYFTKGYCGKHYSRIRILGRLELDHKEPEQHGLSKHPLYRTWIEMIKRCTNENLKEYKYYGGRGITVCDRWSESFVNFLEDMGDKPTKKHSLDRIDNDKGYYKENCRWITQNYQNLNKRKPSQNTSGHKGVSYHKLTNKWRACISFNGEYISLGLYKDINDAIAARKKAEDDIMKRA